MVWPKIAYLFFVTTDRTEYFPDSPWKYPVASTLTNVEIQSWTVVPGWAILSASPRTCIIPSTFWHENQLIHIKYCRKVSMMQANLVVSVVSSWQPRPLLYITTLAWLLSSSWDSLWLEDTRGSPSWLDELGRDTRKCLLGYWVLSQILYYSDNCWWNTGLFNTNFNSLINISCIYLFFLSWEQVKDKTPVKFA